MLTGIKSVLFVGAHTDDEVICAGTLHKLGYEGARVSVLTFSAAGIENDRAGSTIASYKALLPEWESSMKVLGVAEGDRVLAGIVPSAKLKSEYRQQIAHAVYGVCTAKKPDLALILSPNDSHGEHAAVGTECESVLRGRVPHVWRCQFPWNFGKGDSPNLYVSLSQEDVGAKRSVIQCYSSQTFRYQYEEMLMSYCRADGLSVKVPWAEKFEVVRSVL